MFKVNNKINSKCWCILYSFLFMYYIPIQHLLAQSQQWKHQNVGWNLFKVNNEDTRTRPLTLFCCLCCYLWTDFAQCFGVFIVEFEKMAENFEHIQRFSLALLYLTLNVRLSFGMLSLSLSLHKKWSFPLTISSVSVSKSAGNCGFGHIYWKNL